MRYCMECFNEVTAFDDYCPFCDCSFELPDIDLDFGLEEEDE